MKNFYQFIIEETLSIEDALKIFNMKATPSTKAELDKIYKQLALKNHPDLGGSLDMMKKINMAKDVLSKNIGTNTRYMSPEDRKKFHDEYVEKMNYLFQMVIKFFERIDQNAYKTFFENIYGKDFKVSLNIPKKEYKNTGDTPFAELVIKSKDNNEIFTVHLDCNMPHLYDNVYEKSNVSTSTVAFDYYTYSEAFTSGKKQVITRERYVKNSNTDILTKPEVIFPKARMEKLAAGVVRKNSTLKKRDFEAMLKMQYEAFQYKDLFFVPYDNKDGMIYYIGLYRSTLMRQGVWHTDTLWVKDTNKKFGQYTQLEKITGYFQEDQEGFDTLKEIFNYAIKTKESSKIISFIKSKSKF